MTLIEVTQGTSPLVLGLPHTGTWLPDAVAAQLNERGRALADTDWHIHQLYADLVPDLTQVRTKVHRYVVDVNRDPAGESLYPGQNTTSLCPTTDFDGHAIYHDGQAPDLDEVAARRDAYHAPYHAALEAEMQRVADLHGFAVLYDCHSIRAHIPFLFEGTLPDLNIGTNMGATCAAALTDGVLTRAQAADGFSHVLNGRFKGGWTTRHYGRPTQGWHAIQMELAQSTYLTAEAPPWSYDPQKAGKLRTHLTNILEFLKNWRPT